MPIDRTGSRPWPALAWPALALAALAVAAGCALLVALGAPSRMPIVNGAALLVGLVGVGAIRGLRRFGLTVRAGDAALLAASILLPLTAIAAPDAGGMARWLVVGGLTLLPGMIVVPLVAIGAALRPSPVRTAAALVAAFGLALQPDPGGAAMLLAGLAGPLLFAKRPRPLDLAGVVGAAIGLAVAQSRSVVLPMVPFVEHVLPDALAAGIVPALLALASAAFLLAPGITRASRAASLAFLGTWTAALAMALLGPYPTPVIGFGGSGVVGYVLGAGLLALGTARCAVAKDR